MLKTMDEMVVGQTAIVVSVNGERKIKRRLFDMGITNNTEIYLRKKAPLGDPIEITLRGYELTLRKDEANMVVIKLKGDK